MQFDLPEDLNQDSRGEVIPFGKYKGQPIEVLAHDDQYRDWLMTQDWFRSRFPQLVQIVVNNFGQPSETPEHNQMQAAFLDEDWRVRFAVAANEEVRSWISNHDAYVATLQRETRSLKREAVAERLEGLLGKPIVTSTDPEFEYGKTLIDVCFFVRIPLVGECRFWIEIKPTISDDYPATLRQMRANRARHLLYRTYSGSGVDEPTFRRLFQSQGLTTVRESEVASTPSPRMVLDGDMVHRVLEGN